jgi:hypothetical protein
MGEIETLIGQLGLSVDCDHYMERTALGIGDLLITMILFKEKLIQAPIVINLEYFLNGYYPNPFNALSFRLLLIQRIGQENDIPISTFRFIKTNDTYLNQHLGLIQYIKEWNLQIPLKPQYPCSFPNPYIIFHTKYRIITDDYKDIMCQLRQFYATTEFCGYDIILLGERKMPLTIEQGWIKIATVYDDLLQLKNHNNVIDLTRETIYDSLNFDHYISDCHLIKNAYKNIIVGLGGQLVTCLSVNYQSVICLVFDEIIKFGDNLSQHIVYDFNTYKQLLSTITK